MTKNEQRVAKNGKKVHFPSFQSDLFCTESILLRGEGSAVLYGCGRILFYGRERICFSMGHRAVSVFGKDLVCTVFSPMGVTVEGNIAGVSYCNTCSGGCSLREGEEGEA